MKYFPEIYFVSLVVAGFAFAVFVTDNAYSASITTKTIDNSGRREYTYCPISDTLAKSMNAEINGCPLTRVYVNNWNSLTPLQQTDIDTKLRAIGFVDSGENILK